MLSLWPGPYRGNLKYQILLQASFDAAMAQKQALEDDATATQRKMDSANALLSALAGEEGRWTQQSKEFDDTIQKLTGVHAHLRSAVPTNNSSAPAACQPVAVLALQDIRLPCKLCMHLVAYDVYMHDLGGVLQFGHFTQVVKSQCRDRSLSCITWMVVHICFCLMAMTQKIFLIKM